MSIYVGEKLQGEYDENYYLHFADSIKSFIKEEKDVHIISYCFSDDSEFKMLHIIRGILKSVNKLPLENTVYSCVKELVINGAKANIKRLFFEKNKFNIHDIKEYKKGMKIFKRSICEDFFIEFGKIAAEAGLYVKTSFYYSKDGLRIETTNNTPIELREEIRIRGKLALASGYNDLLEFFVDHEDNEEGAGLGIALIVFLLKGEGLDPSLFRIFIKNKITTARIEIPFTKNYKFIRRQK